MGVRTWLCYAALLSLVTAPACSGGIGESEGTDTDNTNPTTSATDPTTGGSDTTTAGTETEGTTTSTTDPTTETSAGPTSTTDDSTTTTTDGTTTTTGGLEIPDPCDNINELFLVESEPNDTPDMASDACTAAEGYWGTMFPNEANPPTLGGDDVVDYWVFKTADAGMNLNISLQPCWFSSVDLIDLTIYDVSDDQMNVVYESATPSLSCEGDFVNLTPNTKFLMELRLPMEPGPPETAYYW